MEQYDAEYMKLLNKLREYMKGCEFYEVMSVFSILCCELIDLSLFRKDGKNMTKEEKEKSIEEFFDFFKKTTINTYYELRKEQMSHVKH